MKRLITLIVILLCLLVSCKSNEKIVPESSDTENSVMEESGTAENKRESEPVKTQSITFPVSDKGKTEFNASIYEIEPFILSLELPEGWTLKEREAPGGFDVDISLAGVWSIVDIFDVNGELIGAAGYNIYELYEGAEDDPRAIYNQIALGNDYQFDIRNSYNVVNETDTGITAVVDVYYAAVINDGVEKINKGIVSYNKDFLVYVAIEFDAGKITDGQLMDIAKSIKFMRNDGL